MSYSLVPNSSLVKALITPYLTPEDVWPKIFAALKIVVSLGLSIISPVLGSINEGRRPILLELNIFSQLLKKFAP